MSAQIESETPDAGHQHGIGSAPASPLESLRGVRVMLVAAGVAMVALVEAALLAAGAETERVHPRDQWRWLFFERQPQLLIMVVAASLDDGGVTADALLQAGLTAHAPVLAITLSGVTPPLAGMSASVPATARAEVVVAHAARLLWAGQPAVTLQLGAVALDASGNRVWVNGHPVSLTPTEYALLAYMMTHRSRVLTYERILVDVWQDGDPPTVRGLAVHFTRLRSKLAGAPNVRLSVMRGVGYCLEMESPTHDTLAVTVRS